MFPPPIRCPEPGRTPGRPLWGSTPVDARSEVPGSYALPTARRDRQSVQVALRARLAALADVRRLAVAGLAIPHVVATRVAVELRHDPWRGAQSQLSLTTRTCECDRSRRVERRCRGVIWHLTRRSVRGKQRLALEMAANGRIAPDRGPSWSARPPGIAWHAQDAAEQRASAGSGARPRGFARNSLRGNQRPAPRRCVDSACAALPA